MKKIRVRSDSDFFVLLPLKGTTWTKTREALNMDSIDIIPQHLVFVKRLLLGFVCEVANAYSSPRSSYEPFCGGALDGLEVGATTKRNTPRQNLS